MAEESCLHKPKASAKACNVGQGAKLGGDACVHGDGGDACTPHACVHTKSSPEMLTGNAKILTCSVEEVEESDAGHVLASY